MPTSSDLRAATAEAARGVASEFPRNYWLERARAGRSIEEMWQALAQRGLLGLGVPETMGGLGGGLYELVVLMTELARAGVPTLHLVLTGLVHASLARNADPQQIDKYMRPSIAGVHRLCLGVTEPTAGTNTFAITTRATSHGRDWRVNGQKTFISGANECEYMFTVVRATDDATATRPALSVLMVPLRARGVTLQKLDVGILQPESQFMVFLDDVSVPADALVGAAGRGEKPMFDALDSERLLVAAMAVGLGEYALQRGVDYARARAPFGRPIGSYQAIQHRFARAKAHLEAAARLMFDAAERFDQRERVQNLCAMAKLLASEAALESCDATIQAYGGAAFDLTTDVITLWPLIRLLSIAPLNNEMILNSIGQHVLGLPKSY